MKHLQTNGQSRSNARLIRVVPRHKSALLDYLFRNMQQQKQQHCEYHQHGKTQSQATNQP